MKAWEKCPHITENNMGPSQTAYSAYLLYSIPLQERRRGVDLERLNGMKNVCLNCRLSACVYDTENKTNDI